MTKTDYLQVLRDNPELPVYCMVDRDVFCFDDYGWYLGQVINARVVEGFFFEKYDDLHLIERGEVKEFNELLDDDIYELLGITEEEANPIPWEEWKSIVGNYMEKLPYKKFISVYVDTQHDGTPIYDLDDLPKSTVGDCKNGSQKKRRKLYGCGWSVEKGDWVEVEL